MPNITTLPSPWLEMSERAGGVTALASELGIERMTLHRWAHGKAVPTKLVRQNVNDEAVGLEPSNRRPMHPGKILREEFLRGNVHSREDIAKKLGLTRASLDALLNGNRAITANEALILSREFGTTAMFWMNAQNAVDLYDARKRQRQ